jgi:hypothetical protein
MTSPDPYSQRRYPSLGPGPSLHPKPEVRATGPGPGSGAEHDPDHASMLYARILIVATIVMGQLWGLTVALDEWLSRRMTHVWWLLGFQALSFTFAVVVWLAGQRDR